VPIPHLTVIGSNHKTGRLRPLLMATDEHQMFGATAGAM
jgi:hypothetical protein